MYEQVLTAAVAFVHLPKYLALSLGSAVPQGAFHQDVAILPLSPPQSARYTYMLTSEPSSQITASRTATCWCAELTCQSVRSLCRHTGVSMAGQAASRQFSQLMPQVDTRAWHEWYSPQHAQQRKVHGSADEQPQRTIKVYIRPNLPGEGAFPSEDVVEFVKNRTLRGWKFELKLAARLQPDCILILI